MNPKDRIDYSAMIDRPPRKGPGGARVIVWPIVNVEDWSIERPMPRQVLPAPTGVAVQPDMANWAWHEYGMRVGFWRLKAALDKLGIVPTLSINGAVCLNYPRVAEAARDAGWEFMGHGFEQMPVHKVEDQAAMIRRTVDTIRDFTGKAPVGWLGPGLTQTLDSVDLLHAAGIRYIGDWVLDDQPVPLRTQTGEMVAMPYSVELNDIPMMAVQHHRADELLRRVTDTFDRLYEEGADQVRVLGLAVHPFLSGVPHRIRYFEQALAYMHGHADVAFMTGEQILAWHAQTAPGAAA
ncbi:polysaccharide deacetylase family protein [Comamonas endophytica]|uniref:Polysaccharide deacetylase family protein n=1 Tax=Comamonas endophytica TaxID=2949090 RepID=A0ABY6GC56_9BURK|nr:MULTISPECIES: polysaccharide deacetylase family protein [unclassified Acidovorax]MCD2513010.1 polysaccharide deacetylase family protein [Acidovorax sp. D4N7]UYG52649.1 polysaccharide deacetylase family protein [Acidovorax sp. 5MLIR]